MVKPSVTLKLTGVQSQAKQKMPIEIWDWYLKGAIMAKKNKQTEMAPLERDDALFVALGKNKKRKRRRKKKLL